MTATVGLDLSMTSTGVAIHIDGATTLHRVQSKPCPTGPPDAKSKGKPTQTHRDKAKRFNLIRARVLGLFPEGSTVYIEGPSYASTGSGAHDIAGNWWLMVHELMFVWECDVFVVSPAQRCQYATGKGAGAEAGKDRVLAAAIRRYPDLDITGNDVADAVVLMALGCRHQGAPIDDVPALNLRALDKLPRT